MKYEHIFHKMPQALQARIAAQPWCQAWTGQGLPLIRILTHHKYLAQLVPTMTMAELKTLRLLISAFGCEPFHREALEKYGLARMAGAEIAVGLTGLRRLGIIAALRKSWGEPLYVLPEDAFSVWQELLLPDVQLQTLDAEDNDLDPLETPGMSARGLAQLLFHFLLACSQQDSLPLTSKGTLHKKQIQKLSKHPVLPQGSFQETGLTYAFRDIYEPDVAILLEMSMQLGILLHDGDRYVLDHHALHTWLSQTYEKQQLGLYAIWRQLYMPAPATLMHGIAVLERCPAACWCKVADVAAAASLLSFVQEPEDGATALMRQWIQPLHAFRWLELATDHDGQIWVKWLIPVGSGNAHEELAELEGLEELAKREEPAEGPCLYVQPDFEVLLAPHASLYGEWQIAAFAVLQSSDLMRTYRITKESFHRAVENGSSSERILHVLQKNAYYEVPEHVQTTLQQWDQQSGKLQIAEVLLLRCESAEVADALARHEACGQLLQERIGAAHFTIRPEHLHSLSKCLEQMGYQPRFLDAGLKAKAKASTAAAEKPRNPQAHQAPGTAQGLFYTRDTVQLYEMDPVWPEWEELYPAMKDVPALWLREFRDYHGSTRKEMIRKAIEWKSLLQLRSEGRNRTIIPRAIYEERSGWVFVGMEEHQEVTLRSDDWAEMKLILPGVNDEESF
ncbi:helicase-associated domain-containing protein [Paenibacillus aestuarii]|uniref:Helicase-associated domain-containing protein n=1 Tax=Paenibacillus aestuarii TaxID=516965 RepID=A0ABW0KKL7_9BACL|nr:helicase-associated domain-containing protein [Paenibacillus aestuarii]